MIALGLLVYWHFQLIYRGETSIEAHINASEKKRLKRQSKEYTNPYDFNGKRNFQYFLGLTNGRKFWSHVLLPSSHKPDGNGLTFQTVYSLSPNHWA